MNKSILLILICFLFAVIFNNELQRLDWNLTVDEQITEYQNRGESEAFIEGMKQDIFYKLPFDLKSIFQINFVFLLNCIVVFIFVWKNWIISKFKFLLSISIGIAIFTDFIISGGHFNLWYTHIMWVISLLLLDITIYWLFLKRKKSYLLTVSFLSIFILQLVTLLNVGMNESTIQASFEFGRFLVATAYSAVVFFMGKRIVSS